VENGLRDERSDGELVAAARAGEPAAFDALMRRYERLVYRLAVGFAPAHEDALDLTQEVFLKAFRALDGFRAEASFKTWLLRIAHHEGLNARRTRSRKPPGEELPEGAAEPAQLADQEERMVAADRRGALARALGDLHDRYRTPIVLRYRHGLPIREIAEVLETTEAMTKNLLFRGVRQLRRALVEAS